MRTRQITTTKLQAMAAPYNPRVITAHDLEALRASMREFGTVEPIVVNKRSGRIVGGHQRVAAAALEGIAQLPCFEVDLPDAKERQLNLALNRISGEFDRESLAAVLRDLKAYGEDLGLTGFTDAELDDILRPDDAAGTGLTDPDAVSCRTNRRRSPATGSRWGGTF